MTAPSVHFLLVDDLDENLMALEGLLRRPGLVLLKARTGLAALELLLTHEVALALIDVRMPGMDGFELAETMRGTERTRRVPIIFVTASSPDQQRRFRGYEAGAVDFLTKPVEPHVLCSKADVFFELWRERQEVARQRDELAIATAENARITAALQDADRRKDEFLATLAHELRNPLAPLRNGLEILKTDPPPEVAAPARQMMDRQLMHMVHLVDDLLDMSRVASGKIRLRPETVELQRVVADAVESSRSQIDAGQHALVLSLSAEPLRLYADATRLAQILANLLTNAAKYTPDGGRIELAAVRQDGHAVITVADNGVGIPHEMLPRVFDLFTQVGQNMDRAQGGLGIGLALVKKLVELHGGTVTAASAGRGSTFTVRLPIGNVAAAAAAPETAKPKGSCVLIVDDNLDGAESLAMVLKLGGHTTRIAHSGVAALDAAAAFDPDVVLLDIGLPGGMNGYDVARALRNRGSTATLVALTGYGSDDDRQRSRDAGFDHHLTKPVELTQIEALLAQTAD